MHRDDGRDGPSAFPGAGGAREKKKGPETGPLA